MSETVEKKAPYLVLGVDPGIASCGFCLLDMANHTVLEMGTHLFDTPWNAKDKTSLAAQRRQKRSARRNLKRTRDRLSHCMNLFKEAHLMPEDADKTWFQPRKGEMDILELRKRGLDELISPRDLARVLYSLAGRRGYIPHGEGSITSADVEDDDKKVLAAIKANAEAMTSQDYRTVGEMLFETGGGKGKAKSRNKGGDYSLCVTNAQIVDEVRALFAAQRQHGSKVATSEFEARYIENLTWEKVSADHDERVYGQVGSCLYFPSEKRAANADLTSEICRAEEKLAHITVIRADGTEFKLPRAVRADAMNTLFSPATITNNKDCKVTFRTLRGMLDLSGRDSFKGVDLDDEKNKQVFVPKAWKSMRDHGLPRQLMERMLDDHPIADAIGEALAFASTEDSLRARLETIDGLSDEDIDAICQMPFSSKTFNGYGQRSLKALEMLVDAFDDDNVTSLYEAERATGLYALRESNGRAERSDSLPPYEVYDPTCKNPVVLRSLSRMRRVINAVIKVHGIPDEIHVELARDIALPKKVQKQIEKNNKKNESERKRIAALIAEARGCDADDVKGKDILKYQLWEEQGNRDIYTGDAISLDRLVSDSSYCQVDHVLPYSQTCDDSRANKVLVLAGSNQRKGNRTPFEWMHSGEPAAPNWEEFRARVQENKRLRSGKKAHLLEEDLDEKKKGDFIARNLNDDRYMSVAVANYIRRYLAFPDDNKKHVKAVAGGATAILRRQWGLNFGTSGEKDREDDRHHAVDAAVIAACSEVAVKRIARANEEKHRHPKEERAALFANTQPWEGFSEDIRQAREGVIPTRMVDHGVTGQAFEETLYRFAGVNEKGKGVLVAKGGQAKSSGNYAVRDDGSARILGGFAFLRLWLDPNARPKGKVKGQWYAEPVYYADFPGMADGTYVPRYMKAHSSRTVWPVIPEAAMGTSPLVVRTGDVISINGALARFKGVGIDRALWELESVRDKSPIKSAPTINNLGKDDSLTIVAQDVLGRSLRGCSFLEDKG